MIDPCDAICSTIKTIEVWDLLAATAALLAFLIGMFTLVGRERKSPYLVNTVLAIFVLCLAGAGLDLLSLLLPVFWACVSVAAGLALLLVAFGLSLARTYMFYVRFHYFIDHFDFKNLPGVLHLRRFVKERDESKKYEYSPLKFPKPVAEGLEDVFRDAKQRTTDVRTVCIKTEHLQQATRQLVDLAMLCLRNGVCVQYLTASRHPIDFVNALKLRAEAEKAQDNQLKSFEELIENKLVVIDAYSAHYAFLDTVYLRKNAELRSMGIHRVRAKMSYAGIHSAAARAFHVLKKKQAGSQNRNPALVVYEDPYALVDLESADQYRVFVRHVLPSERLWDGMLTVVVETAQASTDWDLLQAYGDVVMDLKGAETGAREG